MLSVSGVLLDAAQLYQALFCRTLNLAALVFSIVFLAETDGPWPVVMPLVMDTSVVLRALAAVVELVLERLLAGPLGLWAALTLAATLTTPFAAHALNVVYYRIVDPGRPVLQA